MHTYTHTYIHTYIHTHIYDTSALVDWCVRWIVASNGLRLCVVSYYYILQYYDTDQCICKARRKRGSKEDFAFELAVTSEEGKVKRRYFRASSALDLDAWMEAIKAAMVRCCRVLNQIMSYCLS